MLSTERHRLKLFSFLSICTLVFFPILASAERQLPEKYQNRGFKLPSVEDERVFLKELESRYPKDKWKTFYYCNWEEELILELKAPEFYKWEDCEPKNAKSGEKSCCTFNSAGGISLLGRINQHNINRTFEINFWLHDRQMMNFLNNRDKEQTYKKLSLADIDSVEKIKSENSKDSDVKNILVNDLEAVRIKKQWERNVVSFVAVDRILFQLQGLRGEISFTEWDLSGAFRDGTVPREYRLSDKTVDSIIETIKIKIKTELPPDELPKKSKKGKKK